MTAPTDPQSNPTGTGNTPTAPQDPTLQPSGVPVTSEPVSTDGPSLSAISAEPTPVGDMKIASETPVASVTPDPAPVSAPTLSSDTQPVSATPVSAAPVVPTESAQSLPPIGAEPVIAPSEEKKSEEKKDDAEDDEEEDEDEPQVVERVIIKEKNGGPGCFGLLRNLTCFVISIILLLIAAVVAIVIFKPAFITEPLKTFLNGEYKPADVAEGTSAETVKNYIDEVTNTQNGEVTFQITEDQLTTLVRERFEDSVDVRTGLEENRLQLFIDLAQQGEPLWLIIELTDNGDNLTFSRIGFGRINTPPQLRDFVRDQAFGLVGNVLKDFNFDNSESFAGNFVGGELREGVTIKEVKFNTDLMLVTVEL